MPPSTAGVQPAAPALPGVRPTFIAQGALVGASLAIYLLVLVQADLHHQDLDAYLAAARNLLHGQRLYSTFLNHPFPDPALRPAYIYPPFFALLAAPLALLPPPAAGGVWLVLNQACLAASLLLILRCYASGGWVRAALIGATLTFYPLWIDAVQGQANLLVLLLVTVGLVGVLAGQPRAAAALGVAAALKLTPALLLIWLLADRRFKAAAWLAGGALVPTAAAGLLLGRDSLAYFGKVLPALAQGTMVYANQSLAGVIGRFTLPNPYTHPWLSLPAAYGLPLLGSLLLVGLWWRRARRADPRSRAASFLPLLPLVSALTWPHHLVILLPVIWLVLIALAGRDWPIWQTGVTAVILLGFSVLARWPAGPGFGQAGFKAAQTSDPLVIVTANALFLSTLALFLVAPWLLRSR
jgi:alpha-1,2-mannosyltransferase